MRYLVLVDEAVVLRTESMSDAKAAFASAKEAGKFRQTVEFARVLESGSRGVVEDKFYRERKKKAE